MILPHIVEKDLSKELIKNWKLRFSRDNNGYNRAIRENVWRRHQTSVNSQFSNWSSDNDARRRILHFRDEYALINGDFTLKTPYLFLHLKLPKEEIEEYLATLKTNLKQGQWRGEKERFTRDDIEVNIDYYKESRYDISRKIKTPPNYRYLDITLKAKEWQVPKEIKERAWVAFDTGIRETIPRGTPKISKPKDILPFLPAQIELGCGASIEADIPALNYLHAVYSIKNLDNTFVFRAKDDKFLEIFSNPEKKYQEISYIHLASLRAKPTPFYQYLKKMSDKQQIVGSIITNNFDGLPRSVGLDEFSLRKFDRDYKYPIMEFDKRAKALIVIGSHADRRKAQYWARLSGLQLIYVDPEGYEVDNQFIPYEIESPQNGDLLINMKAGDFMEILSAKA